MKTGGKIEKINSKIGGEIGKFEKWKRKIRWQNWKIWIEKKHVAKLKNWMEKYGSKIGILEEKNWKIGKKFFFYKKVKISCLYNWKYQFMKDRIIYLNYFLDK